MSSWDAYNDSDESLKISKSWTLAIQYANKILTDSCLHNSVIWGWLSMESQPHDPELRNNPENVYPCNEYHNKCLHCEVRKIMPLFAVKSILFRAMIQIYDYHTDLLKLTSTFKYLRKKSRRNDFPFLNAPATDTTTAHLFCISGCRRILSNFSSSRLNVWSSATTTICTGWPFSWVPDADTEIKQQK